MRTRFLATDYSTAGGGGGFPLETLDFVRLPLPDLPPPNYLSFSADFLQTFDEIPIFGAFGEIEKLQIDDALSMFLSDVLPHFVDGVGYEESRVDGSEEKSEVIPSEGKGGTAPNNKGGKFVQFEIPEMDISMLSPKSAVHSQIECSHIFSEIPDAELTMDLLDSELMLHDHSQIQQSIYSVDEMSIEHTMEQEDHMLDDADSVQGELHPENINFPLFELDVEGPGVLGRTYLMDELLSFENIGEQQVAQPDEVNRNNLELLGTMEFDLIKYLLHHSLAIQSLEDSNFSSELDHLSIIELPLHQKYSTLHYVNSDGYSIWSTDPILFDEFLFLDLDPYQFSEVFSDSAKEIEAETCESMFGEAMKFRSFSQLIVCHELTLMDDSFKSLPVPIISDCGNTSSLHSLVEELLSQLDWQSSSASDGLYLDWHFLGEDGSVSAKYSSCWKMVLGIDTYHIDAAMSSSDSGKLIFDFILSEAHSSEQNAENCKEVLNLSCNDVSIIRSSGKADLSSLSNHLSRKRLNEDILLKTGVEKVPVFGESMSSDLDFFLNPRNYITQRESIPADKSFDSNSVGQVLMSCDDSAPANATTVFHQKWNIKIHQVQLSDNILLLLDNLWNNFLVMLENDKELIQLRNQFQASNDFTLLHIPNEKLKLCLHEKIASSFYLTNNDEDIMSFAMLCAIKQMAFYLCYYGIQSTYLYMDKLSTSLQWFKSRLSFLYNLFRDENQNAEKEPSITHPSISFVQGILQTQSSSGCSKILIVSDQVFWSPLKRLLTSLKISYNEPKHLLTCLCQQQHSCDIPDSIMDIMLNSDCCLVSFEYVSASFPFSNFSFILEYGGSNVSSRISSICPNSDGLPTIYFIKVELEELSIAKAISHGVNLPKTVKLEMANLDSVSAQKESRTKLEELLDVVPVKETCDNEHLLAVNEDEHCTMMPVQSMSVSLEPKQHLSCKPFGHDIVIIVNTRNFSEEMVMSRRSTYQKILEMDAAACLTWYDCRNIGRKASAPDEAFSCLPLCVESIAASTLTSLSFAFSCCILIFEGECNFLCSIMESSDELYAAAASLGIDIQLFFSYSSSMTEEIILSCISVAAKLSRCLYPKMSDSESLAESFLTAFPSINPLSAHAILSSDAILGKFLESSNGGRICSLQKYQVPDESIALLSAISRYGEREDSKSGMTDCSSSVSIPDSENVQLKSVSERKKSKYRHEPYDAGRAPNDLFCMESLELLPNDQLNLPKLSVSCNSWLSGDTEISNKSKQFSLSFNDKLLGHSQKIDADMMKKSIDRSSLHNFPLADALQISDETEKPCMTQIDIGCSPRWRSGTATKNHFSRQSVKVTGAPQENFAGEVLDVEDTPAFRENFSAVNSSSFSPSLLDVEKDYAARNSRMGKRPFSATTLAMSTNPTDINSGSGGWVSRKDKRQILREEIRPHFDNINRSNERVEEDILEKAPQNSYTLPFKKKGSQNFGRTPLSSALHSTHTQQGSPWTMEFLNRIREKSRLRKQSVSYDLSSPCFVSPGNTSKVNKRKSPSILELYKYRGGGTPQRTVEQKGLKRSSQPPNSVKNKKASASCPSPLTPLDKRARGTLSFSSNGSGGQSKLVWRDNNYHAAQRRL
ncbi:hypothetical protein CDL12_09056 [Handroanthus impetiginosus]|uniref:Protein SHORTAGE IN CHIASMATA 1 n=1 Tax=Handroanthus impetiginosus TaxID=429701 RepID=A0A2G9HL75_9LAMI|nr:hypothetical protein CDL12_09056 [Handroanthus impetiginosus]